MVAGGYWHVEAPYPNDAERFGVGLAARAERIVDYDIEGLGAGWYLNWNVALDPPHPNGASFMQTIRLDEGVPWVTDQEIRELVRANPGAVWQIANEPDSIWLDNTTPQDYAAIYHHLYHLIKAEDPGARVANGGLVQATPLRLAYLDRIRQSYRHQFGEEMPVDVWTVHGFILREQRGSWGADIPPGMDDKAHLGMRYQLRDHDDLTIFAEQIRRFRQWMADHGQRDKPLILNEYGILMPSDYSDEDGARFSDARVIAFMEGTFDFLLEAKDPDLGYPADDNRLVQAWSWYSLEDNSYKDGEVVNERYNGDLFTGQYTNTMTALGEAYAAYVHDEVGIGEPYTDLAPFSLRTDVSMEPGEGTGTVTVTADIVNHGRQAARDVSVSLWSGSPDDGGTLLTHQTIDEVPGRHEGAGTFEFVWTAVPGGVHDLHLEVDPHDTVVESDNGDNAAQLRTLVPRSWIYLPLNLGKSDG